MIVTRGAPLPGEAGAWLGRFQKGKWTIMMMMMMMMMMIMTDNDDDDEDEEDVH